MYIYHFTDSERLDNIQDKGLIIPCIESERRKLRIQKKLNFLALFVPEITNCLFFYKTLDDIDWDREAMRFKYPSGDLIEQTLLRVDPIKANIRIIEANYERNLKFFEAFSLKKEEDIIHTINNAIKYMKKIYRLEDIQKYISLIGDITELKKNTQSIRTIDKLFIKKNNYPTEILVLDNIKKDFIEVLPFDSVLDDSNWVNLIDINLEDIIGDD